MSPDAMILVEEIRLAYRAGRCTRALCASLWIALHPGVMVF